MTKRIFRSILVVAISVFLASIVLIMGVLYNYFTDISRDQLRMQTELAAHGVENEGWKYFENLETTDYRITWVNADGTVLYDSDSKSEEMENHAEREEIKEALESGEGESMRYSDTLMERSIYQAKRLEDGTVLRLSTAQSTMLTLLLGMFQPICMVSGLAIVLSFVLAMRLSKRVVEPLNKMNLDHPLENEGYDELSPLLRRLDSQQRQIREQTEELQKKQAEFETVTTNMKEGIVLLNQEKSVLSMNRSARRLLAAPKSPVGKNILEINHSLSLQELLNEASEGNFAERIMELGGKKYQFNASPVVADGAISGIVLLLLDVSEKERTQQLRQEFTANVSHELKTPLHTISGCAELMANGIVKQEDIPEFSARIYTETQRLIRLVEDIIKLSHLDEGADDMKQEDMDLYALAQEVTREFSAQAERAGISLSCVGETVHICGVPRLVKSILGNLCDNAIKYNQKDGKVVVSVKKQEASAVLTVSDTGIGIPKEHQSRIFERFYRVDKSHSREIGGTGLGLSIVKHAARLHGAGIELDSAAGKGTTVRVIFPKEKQNEKYKN